MGGDFSRTRLDTVRKPLEAAMSSLRGDGEAPVSRNLQRALELLGGDKEIGGRELQELGGHFTEIGRQNPEARHLLTELSGFFDSTRSSDLLFLSESLQHGLDSVPMDTVSDILTPYDASLRHSLSIRVIVPDEMAAVSSPAAVDATSISGRVSALGLSPAAMTSCVFLMAAIPADRFDLQTVFLDKISKIPGARREASLTAMLTKPGAAGIESSLQRDLDKLMAKAPSRHGEKVSAVLELWAPMKKVQSAMLAAAALHPAARIDRLLKTLEGEFANIDKAMSGLRAADSSFHEGIDNNVRGMIAEFKTGMMLMEMGCTVEFGAKTPAADAVGDEVGVLVGDREASAAAAVEHKPIYLDIDIKATSLGGAPELWMEVKNYKSFSPESRTFGDIATQLQRLMASAAKISGEMGTPPATVRLHLAREAGDGVVAAFEAIIGSGNVMVAFGRSS